MTETSTALPVDDAPFERTGLELMLERMGLARNEGLDPAPPPGPVTRLAADCLRRLERVLPSVHGFGGATSDLPAGEERADFGTHLGPRWALLARGLAFAAVAFHADTPGAPVVLRLSERIDAARAAIALAAVAASDDEHGFFSIARLPEELARLAECAELPIAVRTAARRVGLGLLTLGTRREERELLELLTGIDKDAEQNLETDVDNSSGPPGDGAPCNAGGYAPPDLGPDRDPAEVLTDLVEGAKQNLEPEDDNSTGPHLGVVPSPELGPDLVDKDVEQNLESGDDSTRPGRACSRFPPSLGFEPAPADHDPARSGSSDGSSIGRTGSPDPSSEVGCGPPLALLVEEPRPITWDPRSRRVLVSGVPTGRRLAPLQEIVLRTLLANPSGVRGSPRLGELCGSSGDSARGAYFTMSRQLVFEGRSVLQRGIWGFYALAPGFVPGEIGTVLR